MRKNFPVNMVNTRSAKEHKTKESAVEGPTVKIDLETSDQSVDEVQRKTTESTPMPNVGEQEKKTRRRTREVRGVPTLGLGTG